MDGEVHMKQLPWQTLSVSSDDSGRQASSATSLAPSSACGQESMGERTATRATNGSSGKGGGGGTLGGGWPAGLGAKATVFSLPDACMLCRAPSAGPYGRGHAADETVSVSQSGRWQT